MIYYPLTTLMLAGIRDILIITTPQDMPRFEQLLGDGAQWGISLQLRRAAQRRMAWRRPSSSAREFIGNDPSALVLGDNIFYGHDLHRAAASAAVARADGATVFAYHVHDPERYGVVEFDAQGRAICTRGKARPAQDPTTPSRACISTTATWCDYRREAQAVAARRTGNHRSSTSCYLERRHAARGNAGPRLRLAGYRHARVCCKPHSSSKRSKSGRATKLPARKKSPGARAGLATRHLPPPPHSSKMVTAHT